MSNKVIIVIPARGPSKGIPRKNLRPLCGLPLIAYSIRASLASRQIVRVVVTTDDDEIELFARRFGAEVICRPDALATDQVPLDPVIFHAVGKAEKRWNESYDLIVTVQPTSPLITHDDIESAIGLFQDEGVDTVISATDDRHLRWVESQGKLIPAYSERVNRQSLPPTYRETGAIIACKRAVIEKGTRIGNNIKLYIMDPARSVDIDSYHDLWLCENILNRKHIVITVVGNKDFGLGHAYRSVMIAHELINHEVIFLCCERDSMARDYISGHNYHIETCPDNLRLETILKLQPDMVINDILDTSADYIMALKKNNIIVVNFEDMGLGAEVADLVINALYPHQIPKEHILVGHQYFCLRDEFLHVPTIHHVNQEAKRVLVMFGGVDEGDLTKRTLELVGEDLSAADIDVDVVLGPGYQHHDTLNALLQKMNLQRIHVINSTPKISDYVARADLAITSAGRTVFELVSLGVPTIVIAQNVREITHTFASSENGIINLGLRHDVTDEAIVNTVWKVVKDHELRESIQNRAEKIDLKYGKTRVINKILSLLDNRGVEFYETDKNRQ